MKRSIVVLLVVLGVFAVANANPLDLTENASLWQQPPSGNAGTTLSWPTEAGDVCLQMVYPVSEPFWAQAKCFLPGQVWGNHGVNLTYLGVTTIKFDYKITDQGSDTTRFTIFDCWGQTLASEMVGNGNVTNGWVHKEYNLAAILKPGMNYENVSILAFAASNTWYSSPTGDLWLNELLVPEPATMSILALGGLLLRRRK